MRPLGGEFPMVRSARFAQTCSEGLLRDPILAGALPMSEADIAELIIDIDDIAEVVVAALMENAHRGELVEATGPDLMSFAAMADALSRATGRTILHIPISFEGFHAKIAKVGNTFVADDFTAIARETLDGRNTQVANGVKAAFGGPPRDFSEFAKTAAQSGTWPIAARLLHRRHLERTTHVPHTVRGSHPRPLGCCGCLLRELHPSCPAGVPVKLRHYARR